MIGSMTDLKKREVHDYVSYGLIFIAFGIAILYSIIYWDYQFIAQAAMGFVIGILIAYAMFYLGQWGGGDSKLIMGLGAVIGFNAFSIFGENNFWLLMLLVNIIFVGAIYGLVWSIYLGFKHRKEFVKTLKIWSQKKEILMARRGLLAFVIIFALLILFFIPQELKLVFLSFLAILFIVFYLWLFIKIIEDSCLIRSIPISKLTEGDWIYKDVFIGKKYVTGPKDLGISRQQIARLIRYKKIRKVIVKEGIPFIPAFLIAFILTVMMSYMNVAVLTIFSRII
jgi:hypothetical protein